MGGRPVRRLCETSRKVSLVALCRLLGRAVKPPDDPLSAAWPSAARMLSCVFKCLGARLVMRERARRSVDC